MRVNVRSKYRRQPRRHRYHQRGATLAEFVLVAPLVMFIGMTTVQAGLVYHGKTTLNYATFEAARTGATNNAQLAMMRKELGLRLAPVEGGDGSAPSAMRAMARSSAAVTDQQTTRIKVINPTTAAFVDWGINSQEFNRRVLPNSHLRHREYTIGSESGLSLRDANLLKIEVTHGLDLKVPFVNTLISQAMLLVDPDHAGYYRRKQFPLTSVATVRMQSEAWEEEIIEAALPPAVGSDDPVAVTPGRNPQRLPNDPLDNGPAAEGCEEGEFGLGMSPVLMDAADYDSNECAGSSPLFGGPGPGHGACGS